MSGFLKKVSSLFKRERELSQVEQYDVDTEKIIRKVSKKDSNCIDIGANNGDILSMILKYAPNGMHYAFEPIPDLYRKLVSNYGSTLCKIYDIALSDNKGISSFNYVITNPAYSGLIKRKYDREGEEDTLIEVKTDTLDAMLPANYQVDLIKIDVEGGELPVLRGAVNTIKKWKPLIIFEHGIGASEFYGATPEAVYHLLKDCELRIYTLHGWLSKGDALSIVEFRRIFDTNEEYYFVAQ